MEQFDNLVQLIKEVSDSKEKVKSIYTLCPFSVSKIMEVMHKEFDKDSAAQKKFASCFNNPQSEFYHKSVDEIKEAWEAKGETGRNNGKLLDTYIGLRLDDNAEQEVLEKYKSSINPIAAAKCSTFDRFYKENVEQGRLKFLCRERTICDSDLKVAGRFDALFSLLGSLFLIDWKNSEKISTENKYEKMKGPLYQYDASDLNCYTVQLYIYVYILRKIFKVRDKIVPILVQIGTSEYKIYMPMIPYSDKLVEDVIEFAKNEINNTKK